MANDRIAKMGHVDRHFETAAFVDTQADALACQGPVVTEYPPQLAAGAVRDQDHDLVLPAREPRRKYLLLFRPLVGHRWLWRRFGLIAALLGHRAPPCAGS